jgi:ferredoxin
MFRVTILVSNGPPTTIEVLPGATLLRAVVRARMPIGRSCRGVGICAACRVFVVEGSVAPMDPIEAALAAREPLAEHERYACRACVTGDVTVTTAYW